uniref:DUF4189 domain-containing protein n=1 Tax=Mycobacterium riyadhense TaxID=486698 RepID=A0A653F2X5_9MYCO|nr:hypothetical protein BIN_B_05311 [Mycobacterium riyadhense]
MHLKPAQPLVWLEEWGYAMTTTLRRQAALALATLTAAAAMAVTLSAPAGATGNGALPALPPLPQAIRYGAIAVAPNTGAVGKSWRHRTRADAQYAALRKCGVTSCKVLSSFTRCGAVAHDGSNHQGGTGPTRARAENDAIARLGGGWIVTWACN